MPSPTCNQIQPEYYYDGNSNLIKVDYGNCGDYGIKSLNYFYDSSGNLLKELMIIKLDGGYYKEENYCWFINVFTPKR